MKLIYCKSCGDVVALRREWRSCLCKLSAGKYLEDGLHAEIEGNCMPLGFKNSSFREALQNQPEKYWGEAFTAFVIESDCPTVKVK
jgi:hypothetical protein